MPTPESLVGRVLGGQYRVDALIGQGGFGAVFRGWDEALERPVAIKVIVHIAAARLADRFRREARVQAALRHPATVRLLHFGEDDGLYYMVQEFVDGRTLGQVLAEEGRLTPDRVRALFGQLLDALDEAHAAGVVHRDLKPDNIMLVQGRRGEELRLLDFGIAKIVDDEGEALTGSGMLVGTAAWLSPEQAEDRPVTPRSDLYSAGCVLYRALAGRRPFTGNAPQLVLAHARHAPPPLPDGVPADLAQVVMRAMSKDPEARYADAREMAAALRATGRGDEAETPSAELPPTLIVERPATPPAAPSTPATAPPDEPSRVATPLPVARPRRGPGPAAVALVVLVVGGLAALALGPLLPAPAGHAADATIAAATIAAPDAPGAGPTDAAATDGAIPDAAPRPPVDAAAPTPPASGPREGFASALRRCRCDRARELLDGLDEAARADWRAACGRGAGEADAPRCARRLLDRLDAAMATCPCHGPENQALVQRLLTEFGVDRRTAWAHRCTLPGLPGSCMTP